MLWVNPLKFPFLPPPGVGARVTGGAEVEGGGGGRRAVGLEPGRDRRDARQPRGGVNHHNGNKDFN